MPTSRPNWPGAMLSITRSSRKRCSKTEAAGACARAGVKAGSGNPPEGEKTAGRTVLPLNLNRGRGGLCQQMEAGQADITVCLLFETEGEQMEFLSNLHTHSCFSDGRDTPEEIVREALRKGFISLGFSDHSPTPYFSDCNMPEERTEAY
ncbi:MAG TPA: hypothetical protein H9671_06570, partial [Firmicutes bacterium]|nr:hypothetical protein [Bacillota bacterium]